MSTSQTSDKSQLLTDLPPYIYGTTRLGDNKIPFEERVSVARAAMDGTDWFHTSHTYGNALEVLRAAFDQERAVEVVPIFERSGIEGWTEFCVRFAHSFPRVRATVGSTSRLENLKEFLEAAENIEPLPADIVHEITQLYYRWSDEFDRKTEIWTM